jgi:ABC-type transport system involved in cytochrome bd biosynthesis fused ATPase/permease subunit
MNYLTYINNNFLDTHMLADIFISVGLIGIGIAIFFFTYASIIEEEIVISQTKILINDLMQGILPLLTLDQRQNLAANISAPNNKKADIDTLNNNNKLINNSYKILMIILIASISIGLVISIVYKHNFYYLLAINILIFVFIMLTEFVFIHIMPKNYIVVDTNWVKWKILTEIRGRIRGE